MPPEPNPAAPEHEKPLLTPWVSLAPEPTLFYSDARGQLKALTLTDIGLARLGLSIAEAQAALARAAIDANSQT